MSRDGITYEQVATTADALISRGTQPTIKAIRDELGTGSPNTVHRHLLIWRDAKPTALANALVPASLTSAIAVEIGRAAASARMAVEARLSEAKTEAAELSEAGVLLEADRDLLAERVVDLTTQRDKNLGKVEQLNNELMMVRTELDDSKKACQRAEQQVAVLNFKLSETNTRINDANEAAQNARRVAEKAREEAAELRGRFVNQLKPSIARPKK